MLASSDLAEALTHSDPLARDQALWSLSAAGIRSGVPADVALAAIDALGAEAFARPLQICELAPGPQTLARLLASYHQTHDPHLARWIAGFPQKDLAAEPAVRELADRGGAGGDLAATLKHRLALGAQSPESLWNELGSGEPAAMLALVEHEQFAAAQVTRMLSRPGDPLEKAAIELAGRLHMGTALDYLLDRFTADDAIADAAVIAVGRIGTAGAVTAIEQRCDRMSAGFRLRAAQCLARFRVPSVEATLFRLLVEEDDPAVTSQLARALATICTTTSFDRLCEMARSGKCADADMKQQLAGLSVLLKKPLPELEVWRGTRTISDRSFAIAVRGQHAAGESPSGAPPIRLESALPEDFANFAPEPDEGTPQVTPPAPIRRATTKVGRNDPCPCGSGRKYKKCCGA